MSGKEQSGIFRLLFCYFVLSSLIITSVFPQGTQNSDVKKLNSDLKSSQSSHRLQALRELKLKGTSATASVPAVLALLKDKDSKVRDQAAITFAAILNPDPLILAALCNALKDKDSEVRTHAARWLGGLHSSAPPVIAGLIVTTNDKDPKVRQYSIEAIWQIRIKSKEALCAVYNRLDDQNPAVREMAILALSSLQVRDPIFVRSLIAHTKDKEQNVRRAAIEALGNNRIEASVATPLLLEALKDNFGEVRLSALFALVQIEPPVVQAIPLVIKLAKGHDNKIRYQAISALGTIGTSAPVAITTLIECSEDQDMEMRTRAITALGGMKTSYDRVVPTLITATQDQNWLVRMNAVISLGRIGSKASLAIPTLKAALRDNQPNVRFAAAESLGKMGTIAESAFLNLVEALKDQNGRIYKSSADSIKTFAEMFENLVSKSSDYELLTRLSNLQKAKITLTKLQPTNEDDVASIKKATEGVNRAILALNIEQQRRFPNYLRTRMSDNWLLVFAIVFLVATWSISLLLLWLNPLALLSINDALIPVSALKLPAPLDMVALAPGYILGYGVFRYSPRVLDAWVSKYVQKAREEVIKKPTFALRLDYVEISVTWNKNSLRIRPADLQDTFAGNSVAFLLQGDGGSGKTTMACQMALWAMGNVKGNRLCASHIMLPALIEENIAGGLQSDALLLNALRRRVVEITGMPKPPTDDLLKNLLEKKRLLVIVDGISELDEATRNLFLSDGSQLPLNALILTSRRQEPMRGPNNNTIETNLLDWNQVSAFLTDYLKLRGNEELVMTPKYIQRLNELSTLVGSRPTTALLIRLYADYLLTPASMDDLIRPRNVPELMDKYVDSLCDAAKIAKHSYEQVHRMARQIAWKCLTDTLVPGDTSQAEVQKTLAAPSADGTVNPFTDNPALALDLFVNKLKLLQKRGITNDRLKVILDPLAEYLAAYYLVTVGSAADKEKVNKVLADPSGKDGPDNIAAGFIRALSDTWKAQGNNDTIPDFILPERRTRFAAILQLPAPPPPGRTV